MGLKSIPGSIEDQKSSKDHDESQRRKISSLKAVSEGLGNQNDLKSQHGGLRVFLGVSKIKKA